jgi:hypothetical protein
MCQKRSISASVAETYRAHMHASCQRCGIGASRETTTVVGEFMTYECPREPGGEMRPMASLHTAAGHLLKPIIGPRMTGTGHSAFTLRGLEELKTERGYVYVLQEWLVTDVQDAQKGQP